MNTKIKRIAALSAASAPAAGLALVAGLSQNLYAASVCFDPVLQIYSQESPATVMATGDAGARLNAKPPFVLLGAAHATGYLSSDGGVSASNAMGSVSRLWTTTCSDWAYGWAARGSVVGQIKAKASKTWPGSATASCSFTATAAGDLSPAAHDARVASSSTVAGGSVSMTVGVAPPNASYSIGQTSVAQMYGSSTNPAGDAKTLYDGPKMNVGAGSETVVVVNLAQEHSNSAFGGVGGSSSLRIRKSDASTAGYAGAAVTQDLFAVGPWGLSTGISVYPGTGIWRWAKMGNEYGATPEYGPWKPPFGSEFEAVGARIEEVDEPPLPPDPAGREANDGTFHRED